jgi:hypothetical protein
MEPLTDQWEAQHRTFELYKAAALSDERADNTIINLYRQNVIGVQRIRDILGQWIIPPSTGATAPRGGSSTPPPTSLLAGWPENPVITRQVHHLIDGLCQLLN